jgi:Ca2+-binding EF-hand superfamily protein
MADEDDSEHLDIDEFEKLMTHMASNSDIETPIGGWRAAFDKFDMAQDGYVSICAFYP